MSEVPLKGPVAAGSGSGMKALQVPGLMAQPFTVQGS